MGWLWGSKSGRVREAGRRGRLSLYDLDFDSAQKKIVGGNVQALDFGFHTRNVARDGAALALFEKDPRRVVATLTCPHCGHVHAISRPNFPGIVGLGRSDQFGRLDRYTAGWSSSWFTIFFGGNRLTCQACGQAGLARVDLL